MQDTVLDHCVEVREGVWVEEYHRIFHNSKYEKEVCPGTECMLEVMWAGGGNPHTYFAVPKDGGILGRCFERIKRR